MMKPSELAEYIETFRAAGITGAVTVDGVTFTIPPVVTAGEARTEKPARLQKQNYDAFLFACTEGFPEDADEAKS